MKEKLQAFWSIPKNRILIFILAALVAFLLLDPLADDAPAASVPAPAPAPAASQAVTESKEKTKREPVAVETNKNPVLKDPFMVPIEYQEVKNQPPNARQAATVSQGSSAAGSAVRQDPQNKAEKPVAKGVIGSGNQYVAILEYGEESRQCAKGEYIGPYRVASVYSEWVTLEGPEGTIALKVGR